VAFDLMRGHERAPFAEFTEGVQGNFVVPHLLHVGRGPCSINRVQELLAGGGGHGALDGPEDAVWRVERRGRVDFPAKRVRPDKVDGRYLPEVSGQREVWNWRAETF
jgi:hypothetical protein